jgi:hypothetical protein
MAETQVPLVKLLMRPELKERYGQKKDRLQLLCY